MANKPAELVKEWMNKNPITLTPQDTAFEAARIMTEQKIGSILIKEKDEGFLIKKKGNLTGIMTDTDIVQKVMAKGVYAENIKLHQVMTPEPITLDQNAPLIEASRIITNNKIKRIPVLKQGKLEGIITVTDLMFALVKLGKIYEVSELVKYIAKSRVGSRQFQKVVRADKWMNINVVTCSRTSTIYDVAVLMEKYKVGSVVVLDKDKVAGIITDTDLIRKVCAAKIKPEGTKVEQIMSSPVVSVEQTTGLLEVAELMSKHKIKRIPVVQNGRLLGIISVTDLLDALIQLNNFSQAHKIIEMLYGEG
ncbi:CBS domain-containing protein [Candidatus Woesearchaeota archaeon]|nr:MAG: CBS domain-containing protein [Candidatus Woesearchaeota archaeon]